MHRSRGSHLGAAGQHLPSVAPSEYRGNESVGLGANVYRARPRDNSFGNTRTARATDIQVRASSRQAPSLLRISMACGCRSGLAVSSQLLNVGSGLC